MFQERSIHDKLGLKWPDNFLGPRDLHSSRPLINAEKVCGKSGGLVEEIPLFQGNLGW